MAQLLVETVQTKIDVKKGDNDDLFFEGIFGQAVKRNLNGRVYPMKVMEKAVNEYNENFVQRKRALGELDHPEEASVNLARAAFVIEEDLKMNDKGEVRGKARILKNTPMGNIAYNLMKEGITIGLSSRGLGEVASKKVMDEELGEEVEINEVSDFSLACFDLVSEPSIGHFVSTSNPVTPAKEAAKKPEEKKLEEKKLDSANLLKITQTLFE